MVIFIILLLQKLLKDLEDAYKLVIDSIQKENGEM